MPARFTTLPFGKSFCFVLFLSASIILLGKKKEKTIPQFPTLQTVQGYSQLCLSGKNLQADYFFF